MNTRKFLQKILLSLIAIIPGILGLFFGYNRGQVTTQNKTIETFNGSQSIAANNLIVNYNSETDNYDDKLNEIIKNLSTSAQDNQELTSKNSQLIQENFTIQEENTRLKKRLSIVEGENSKLQEQITILEKQISIPENGENEGNNVSSGISDEHVIYLLDECPPYESDRYEAPITINMMGNTYANGFQLNAGFSGFVLFNLDGKYDTLEFDFGHVDGSSMENVEYNIYIDGKFLQTVEGIADMRVTRIFIPLNYASQMKIDFSSHSGYPIYGFANATLT